MVNLAVVRQILAVSLLATVSAPSTGISAAVQRVPNTTLAMPTSPPTQAFTSTNAFGSLTFTNPTTIFSAPGDTNRLFIVEKRGRIVVITNLAVPTRSIFMDISDRVLTASTDTGSDVYDERGLLGMAFHPGYATNRLFYVFYTGLATTPGIANNQLHDILSSFQVSASNPNRGDNTTEVRFIRQYDQADNHNAGDLHFGPDGYLYVSLGDEGGSYGQFGNTQRIDKDFFSAIMRLDVNNLPGSLPPNPHPSLLALTNYSIPPDNPYVGVASFNGLPVNPSSVRTEFWAVGMRNPWRFSFDPDSGVCYLGHVGQDTIEWVNLISKGSNPGWNYFEGSLQWTNSAQIPPGFVWTPPLTQYGHTNGRSGIIGGIVYRGSRLSQLYGAYLYGDLGSGEIWALRNSGTNVTQNTVIMTDAAGLVTCFGVDPANGDALYAAARAGTNSMIKRIIYTSSTNGPALPPTLADTGAFTDLSALTVQPGILPYDINVPFWSDNAIKTRWFSVPNTNQTIGFSPTGNWSFPTGTVWIKHFELQLTNGVPSSTRRLETRLLVKNAGGVYGVTYRWGNSLTNATLVAEQGLDESFVIDDGGGILRTQVWHYPSRAECLTCHTTAGGYGLGFTTAQLNRNLDYGTGPTNEIVALSQAGYFSTNVAGIDTLPVLAGATNNAVSLEYRVRSYLTANCSQCHQPANPVPALWDARIATPTAQAGIVNGALLNNLGDTNNHVITPLSAANSVMLTRISTRGPLQMPPLDSTVVDAQAVALLSQWIGNLTNTFWMAATPLSQSVQAGGANVSYSVTNLATSDFTSSVALGVSGLPPGASAGFSPASITGSGSAAMTVTAPVNTPPGNYLLTITGSGGGLTNTATVTLVVSPTTPDLSVNPTTLAFSVLQGSNPASQALGITNSGGGTLNWTAMVDTNLPAWLTLNPTNGAGNGIATVAVASANLVAGVYSKTITVSAAGASHSPQTVTVNLTVNGNGTNLYSFTYPDRTSLLAAGWDFLARTASGAIRNTEQTNGAVVSYDQVAHPGVLRIPADSGDLWAALNNSQNTVFRDVPTNWTSLRLKFAFAPTQNYQQASVVAYQDDDDYAQVTREYNGGNKMTFVSEIGGSPGGLQSASVTATTNLYVRLDQNVATGSISGYYSLNGTTWVALGSVTQRLSRPRLGIFVGASYAGFPNADFSWAQVIAPQTTPALSVSPTNLTFSAVQGSNPANQVFGITNSGGGTLSWAAVADTNLPAWLAVNPTNGVGNGTVSVAIASASLALGVYSKAITVSATGVSNSPQTVTVSLTVTPPPSLSLTPAVLNFTAVQGSNPASQVLGITNSGGGTLNWTAVADTNSPPWLTLSPTNGVGNGTARVAVASANLAPGMYSKSITVSAGGASNSPQIVTVNLTVNPPPPSLTVNPATLSFAVVQGSNPTNQVFGITNSGGGTLNWTAIVDTNLPPWLTVNPTNGVDNGTASVAVASASLAPGLYSKRITVSAAGASNSPQIVTVNLTVNPPPSLTLTPAVLNFTAVQGSNPASQVLGITNGGGGTLNWTAVADTNLPPWLTVSPTNGVGNGTASVAVASTSLTPGVYSKTITVTATGASNSPQIVAVNLTVSTANGGGTNFYYFTYTNRASLLAAGWDFLARTASGATRNTEQTNGAVVSYDQVAHPGVLRIPADSGDLWAALNNSQNTLFQDVPTNWTSLRLKFAFAPTQNYQQASLVAYQDDDNYAQVTREYNGGNKMTFVREIGGSPGTLQSASVTATTNLYVRLDQNVATGSISGYYSLNGTTWVALGSGTQRLSRPRLGIFVGASYAGFPNADFSWAEVIAPQAAPLLVMSSGNPVSGSPIEIYASEVANHRFGFGFLAQPSVKYIVEYKKALSDPDWTTLTNLVGTGSFAPVVDPAEMGASRFYRIRVP